MVTVVVWVKGGWVGFKGEVEGRLDISTGGREGGCGVDEEMDGGSRSAEVVEVVLSVGPAMTRDSVTVEY